MKLLSAVVMSVLFSIGSLTEASAQELASKWVCKKRSRQVYSAFYRTEVVRLPDGQFRFDYGIGDQVQIYDLYFASLVVRDPSSTEEAPQFSSPTDENPRVEVSIQARRGKKRLVFSVTPAGGRTETRGGYICE